MFNTLPPTRFASIVNDFEARISIFWEISPDDVTAPLISVLPAPSIALTFVPPTNSIIPLFTIFDTISDAFNVNVFCSLIVVFLTVIRLPDLFVTLAELIIKLPSPVIVEDRVLSAPSINSRTESSVTGAFILPALIDRLAPLLIINEFWVIFLFDVTASRIVVVPVEVISEAKSPAERYKLPAFTIEFTAVIVDAPTFTTPVEDMLNLSVREIVPVFISKLPETSIMFWETVLLFLTTSPAPSWTTILPVLPRYSFIEVSTIEFAPVRTVITPLFIIPALYISSVSRVSWPMRALYKSTSLPLATEKAAPSEFTTFVK